MLARGSLAERCVRLCLWRKAGKPEPCMRHLVLSRFLKKPGKRFFARRAQGARVLLIFGACGALGIERRPEVP